MMRAWSPAFTFLLILGHSGFAEARAESDGNAALKYWQAFATLPTFNDAESKKLAEVLSTPLDDLARKIVSDADYSLRMMHRAAAQPRCDWGVSHEEGIFTRLPQGNAARVLASVACLRARMRFEAGQNGEAVDDLIAGMALGRHCSLSGTNIMLLVGYGIEHRMTDVLALELPRLNVNAIPDLKSRLAALPAGMSMVQATESEEKSYLDWFVRTVKKARDKDALVASLAFIGNGPEGQPTASREKTQAFIEQCGGTADAIVQRAEETHAAYGETVKMLALPLDQFEKEFERNAKKYADNPVYQVFFPAMINVRRAVARMEVRRALLSAALTVRQQGPEALKNHPDPVGGGPFEYRPFAGGFELRSRLKGRDDKPVTLTVGKPG
jgi:hypothetical protein